MPTETTTTGGAATQDVCVIIVNYQTPELAIACLESLEPELRSFRNGHVMLIDNDSGDGSHVKLGEAIETNGWSSWVTLMPLPRNGGYAYGNNAGIRAALKSRTPDFFWLVNPDTVVKPGAGRLLVEFMLSHPEAAICGSRLEDADGTAQVSAFRFPGVMSELDSALRLGVASRALNRFVVAPEPRNEAHPTDWVSGASLMFDRRVIETAGLMDERYFLYYEEVDFMHRARELGYETWYVPASRLMHHVGAATGISELRKKGPRRPRYWFDSRRRYFLKNYGKLRTLAADLAYLAGFSLWRVRRLVQRKPDLDPPKFLWDFFRNSVFVRGFRVRPAAESIEPTR